MILHDEVADDGFMCAFELGSCETWRWWVSQFLPSTCSKAQTTIIIPGMTAEGDESSKFLSSIQIDIRKWQCEFKACAVVAVLNNLWTYLLTLSLSYVTSACQLPQ
jgi:hypothetical protein